MKARWQRQCAFDAGAGALDDIKCRQRRAIARHTPPRGSEPRAAARISNGRVKLKRGGAASICMPKSCVGQSAVRSGYKRGMAAVMSLVTDNPIRCRRRLRRNVGLAMTNRPGCPAGCGLVGQDECAQ